MQEKKMTNFETVDDVEEALLASCRLMPLAGGPFKLRDGNYTCDGGIRAFQPRKGERNVICISPLYFTSADIRPSKFVPVWWGIYPPPEDQYRALFTLGYNDAMTFFYKSQMLVPHPNSFAAQVLGLSADELMRRRAMDWTHRYERSKKKANKDKKKEDDEETSTPPPIRFDRLLKMDMQQDHTMTADGERPSSPPQLRESSSFTSTTRLPTRTWRGLALDTLIAFLYLCVLRPFGLACVYVELFFVSSLAFWMALLHDVFPRAFDILVSARSDRKQHGTRGAAFKDWYHAVRNVISLRVLMHLAFGNRVPVNEQRLEKYSRTYKMLQPFL